MIKGGHDRKRERHLERLSDDGKRCLTRKVGRGQTKKALYLRIQEIRPVEDRYGGRKRGTGSPAACFRSAGCDGVFTPSPHVTPSAEQRVRRKHKLDTS